MSGKRWFLPETPDLLAMLRDQVTTTVIAMDALSAWAAGDPNAAQTVRDCEHRADDQKRTLWRALREAFSTPLDAEDLFTLSAGLDEVLNAAKDLVREMEVMDMAPDGPTREMVGYLSGAVADLSRAFACLGTGEDATRFADGAIARQRRVEHAYRRAMSALLEANDVADVVGRREIYRRLARIGDLVHATADRVWYAVVKEA